MDRPLYTAQILPFAAAHLGKCDVHGITGLGTQAAAKRSDGNGSRPSVSGRDAFVLYDTYGFPLEITQELAAAQGVTIDLEGFAQEMQVCI